MPAGSRNVRMISGDCHIESDSHLFRDRSRQVGIPKKATVTFIMSMPTKIDIVLIKANNQKRIFQSLSKDFSGIEPPLWIVLTAAFFTALFFFAALAVDFFFTAFFTAIELLLPSGT